jgi:hypothetical protein
MLMEQSERANRLIAEAENLLSVERIKT